MTDHQFDERIVERVRRAAQAGRLVTLAVPGSKDMKISVEQSMVDEGMAFFAAMPEDHREHSMTSIRKSIKRATKKLRRGTSSQKERDELATDCALWLAHELMFADGEKHLEKMPELFDEGGELKSRPQERD